MNSKIVAIIIKLNKFIFHKFEYSLYILISIMLFLKFKHII